MSETKLHLYRNESDWYVAATLMDAVEVAREWQSVHCGIEDQDLDLDLWEEADGRRLTLQDEDDRTRQTMTCAEWAAQYGVGFFTSMDF